MREEWIKESQLTEETIDKLNKIRTNLIIIVSDLKDNINDLASIKDMSHLKGEDKKRESLVNDLEKIKEDLRDKLADVAILHQRVKYKEEK